MSIGYSILLSEVIVERWNVIGQKLDDRDISDHCHVWLVVDYKDWGPKSFKLNNEWFLLNSFIPFFEKE